MEAEVNRVPDLRIGEGAKPGPNDGTKYINPVPSFPGGDRGRDPEEYAMEKEVNSVPKGSAGSGRASRASKGTDFAARQSAIRKKN